MTNNVSFCDSSTSGSASVVPFFEHCRTICTKEVIVVYKTRLVVSMFFNLVYIKYTISSLPFFP